MWGWAGKQSSTQTDSEGTASSVPGHRLILLLSCLAVVEIAFCITILVLVTEKLDEGRRCLLSDGPADMCSFSYASSIMGAVFSLTKMFSLCRPPSATMLATGLAAIYWLGYAISVTVYAANVDNAPGGRYRVAVCALGWSTFICHSLACLLAAAAYRSGWKEEALFESSEYMIPNAIAFKERQAAAEAAKAAQPGPLARMSAAAAAALHRMSGGGAAPAPLGRSSMGGKPPMTAVHPSSGGMPPTALGRSRMGGMPATALGRGSMGPAGLARSSMSSVASENLAQPRILPQPAVNGTPVEAVAATHPPPTVERV